MKVWKKPSYRALTLRMALRGPPAEFIEQEANMQQEWVKDDAGILGKVREIYIKNTAVELHIAFVTKGGRAAGRVYDPPAKINRRHLPRIPGVGDKITNGMAVLKRGP